MERRTKFSTDNNARVRLAIILFTVALGVAALSQIGSPATAGAHNSVQPATITQAPPPSGAYFDHVVIIVMEDHGMNQICARSPPPCSSANGAPYLAGLANNYSIGSQYLGVSHFSQADYIALLGGDIYGCIAFPCTRSDHANLVDRLEAAGLTWKGYMENQAPLSGCDSVINEPYTPEHNPFIFFNDILNNTARCGHVVRANPSGCAVTDCSLVTDLNSASAPNFMWLTPNNCNNMHGVTGVCPTSIPTGDNYLKSLVPNILNSSAFKTQRSALFVVFDEGETYCPLNNSTTEDCVYAVWAGSGVKTNFGSSNLYNHYSWTKTIETNWGLPRLSNPDGNATALTEFFLPPDFTIIATSPPAVNAGQSAVSTITITAVNGFAGVVTLTDTVPAGLTCGAITPGTVTGSGTATVSCSATVAGTYTPTLTGTSGSLVHTATATLNFQDFSISASSPVAVNAGTPATSTITIASLNGFRGNVSLTSTVPNGLTCGAIFPNTINGGAGTATISCSAAVAGNYNLTVTATNGALTHSATATFRVQDFTIAATSPAHVNVGVSANSTITVTALNGFAGNVTLADIVPSGLACGSITPSSVTGSGTATVSCTSTSAVNYNVTITGTSSPLTHSVIATFGFVDFTITATSPADFNTGATGTSTVTITPLNGFSGKVTLTTTVAPSTGLTPICPAYLNVTSASVTGKCIPSSTSPGVYMVTITGTNGALTHTSRFIAHVGDFSISATSPSGNAGFTITSNVTLTSFENFAGSVALNDTAPAGLICTAFTATPVTLTSNGTGTSKLSCTSTTPGTYSVIIRAAGSPGTSSHSTTATFTFAPSDFSITASSPADFNRGATGNSTITVTPIGNFIGTVTLTTTVSPSTGLAANCPATLVVTSGAVTGTCSPSSSTPGAFLVNVTGTGGSHTHSAIFFSHVGDFSLSTTSPTGVAGSLLNSTITMTSTQNFAGSITLADNVPTGLSCRVFSASPVTLTKNGTAASTLSCSSTVAGTFTVTIIGTGSPGDASHNATAVFRFTDFTVTTTSPAPVNAGISANSTITIGALNGFNGTTTLSDTVPSGLSCGAITPASVTGSGSAIISCSAAAAGNYTLTITGTSAALAHNATVTFRFQDFGISANPTTITVIAGSAAKSTTTVTGLNGFARLVSLATNSTSCVMTPTSVTGSGNSTLSCTFAASGVVHVTITGTSSSLSHSAIITFTVQDFTLTANPTSVVVDAGATGTSAITVTSLQGFSGLVNLATNSTACNVTPISVSGSGSSTLSCTFASASTVHITVTGTSGSRSHAANVTYTVQDFTISANPTTVSVAVGQTGTATLTISAVNGFTGTVDLTSSVSPAGLNATLTPTSVILGGSQTSTLTVRASTAGSYTVTVTAKSGPLSHNVTLTILVSNRPLVSVVVGLDGSLYWNSMSATGSASGWQALGGTTPSPPALCQSGPGGLELVVRGMDNGIYHKSFTSGTWSSTWDSPGGATNDQPACAVLDGTLYVVVRGLSNVTYANSMSLATLTWSGWVNLSGQTPSAPVLVVTPSVHRLDLVVRGLANGIYHKAFVNGAWTAAWDTPGGTTPDIPAAVSDGSILHLVVRGGNNGLWYNSYNFASGSWSNWFSIGGATATAPSLAIDSSGTLHLLVTGLANGIWHISRTAAGVWSPTWDSPGGATSNRIAVTTIGTNVIILATGLDNSIYLNVLTGTSWQTWTPMGGETLAPMALSSIP